MDVYIEITVHLNAKRFLCVKVGTKKHTVKPWWQKVETKEINKENVERNDKITKSKFINVKIENIRVKMQ